jgi:Ribbon-helix-helix protein, copG family
VHKTTIYLSDELRQRVKQTARREQRPEADVIRAAIAEYTTSRGPRPTLPLFDSGRVKPIEDWDEAMRGFGED